MRRLSTAFVAFASLSAFAVASAEEIKVIGWNVESGGAHEDVIAEQLSAFEGYHLWGLSEVRPQDAEQYADAIAADEENEYFWILGGTGGGDRLLIVFDGGRFEQVGDAIELDHLKEGNGRSPLAVKLKSLADGAQFIFMVNHLYRSDTGNNAGKRERQARGLNAWALSQGVPVIAVGDYNFDFDVPDGPGNSGLTGMVENDVFRWVRPPQLVKTQDSNFNSVLDFVFVAGDAKSWGGTSRIIVRPADFPNDDETSDHRPLEGIFETTAVPTEAIVGTGPRRRISADTESGREAISGPRAREDILRRLDELEMQILELRRVVRALPE